MGGRPNMAAWLGMDSSSIPSSGWMANFSPVCSTIAATAPA